MLALDKGTVSKDCTRQIIVATTINSDGLSEETFITANKCPKATAEGAVEHLTENAGKLINLQNVAVVCTDGAAYYVGPSHGMMKQLQEHKSYNENILHLNDAAHSAELLMVHTMADWVIETTSKTKNICSNIMEHYYKIHRALAEMSNCCDNLNFTVLQQMVTTRYCEYAHRHFESILRNVKVMAEALPAVLADDPDPVSTIAAKSICSTIFDPAFIVRMLLIKKSV